MCVGETNSRLYLTEHTGNNGMSGLEMKIWDKVRHRNAFHVTHTLVMSMRQKDPRVKASQLHSLNHKDPV